MKESQRDVIQDKVGNPIVAIGGWYARACSHPESAERCLWIIRRAAKTLLENIDAILKDEGAL